MEAARALDVNPVTYQHHENGRRKISRKAAEYYSRAFGVPAGQLLYGEILREPSLTPVAWQILDEGRVTPIAKPRLVEQPAGEFTSVIAATVATDKLWPHYRRGDVLFFRAGDPPASAEDHGYPVLAITEDGQRLLTLPIAQADGRFTLLRVTQGPIAKDVHLKSAAPLVWLRIARPKSTHR